MIVAKLGDRIVEITGFRNQVSFSTERGWIMINYDIDKPNHKAVNVRWVPASTRFEWVTEFNSTT